MIKTEEIVWGELESVHLKAGNPILLEHARKVWEFTHKEIEENKRRRRQALANAKLSVVGATC